MVQSVSDAEGSIAEGPVEQQEHDLRRRVLRDPGVRALIGARFTTSLCVATMAYGAMVYLATIGAPQVVVSLALMLLSLGFVLFGLIDVVAPILAPFSPLRLLGLFGIALSPEMEAAGLISIFTALGSTGAGAAVQTYVNRYVLLARQATTFGMQEVLDNALTLLAVIGLGLLTTVLGPRLVFVVAPPLIIAIVVWLIRLCFRVTDQDPPQARRILRALLQTGRDDLPPIGAPR